MKESGLILNQGITLSLSAYEVSKKVIHLLLSQKVQREDDGAFQFWRIKEHLHSQFPKIPCWSDDRWKLCLTAGGGAKGDTSTALVFQEQLFFSELFKDTQDVISLILH